MWAIPKPGRPNEPRFVTDLRAQNKITKDERQPLINQELMRETAARARFVSKFDMRDSYFQTRVEEQYEDNNTINTPFGIFKVRVMIMGYKRSPSPLTRAMMNIYCEYIGKSIWIYLDDIIVYSDTLEDVGHVAIVPNLLDRYEYYLDLKKCQF